MHTFPRINFLQFCADFPVTINERSRLEVLWRTIILDSTFDGVTPAPNDYGASFLAAIVRADCAGLAQGEATLYWAVDYFTTIAGYLDLLESKHILDDAITSAEILQYMDLLRLAHDKKEPLPQVVLDIHRKSLPYTRSEGNPRGLDRLFRTKKGYMGVSRGPCQKGDQVWAVRNAHVPFVLRENSSSVSFELVGTCFILDKMQGEMIRGAEEVKTIRLV